MPADSDLHTIAVAGHEYYSSGYYASREDAELDDPILFDLGAAYHAGDAITVRAPHGRSARSDQAR